MSLSTSLTFTYESNAFFAKSVGQVRMRMIIIVSRSGDPRGEPESTTLLTLLPVLLTSRVLAFFLIFRFQFIHGKCCVRYAHSSRNHVRFALRCKYHLKKDEIMVINCAFIGFGKTPPVTICRMYLTARIAGMSRYFSSPCEAGRTGSHLFPYPFTSDLDEVLNDPDVKLVVVCTMRTATSSTRSARWKPGKMCGRKTVHSDNCAGERAFCTGESKGLTVTPYQNRRFDSCFLKRKKRLKAASLERLSKWKAI